MDGLNRQQLFAALIGLVAALFVMGGLPGPWRRQLRIAAIAVFMLALVAALVQIALWLGEPGH
jgi:cell division protein FtsW (lipid II flippase)